MAALLGTIGTAVVGGTAKADEPCRTPASVTVAAPPVVTTPVAYHYGDRDDYGYGYRIPGVMYRRDRREDLERMRREQRESMMRHARWLHEHGAVGRGFRR
ncbi:MAG TPA: hypothetical protein VF334_16540 [Polyangia bacterium]